MPDALRGQLTQNASLARYTTWHVGGPAKQLYQPADAEDLAAFLASLPVNEKILWIGMGSNLLVSDDGFDGTVILTRGSLNQIKSNEKTNEVYAEAGAMSAKLSWFALDHALTGLEYLVGIPGTVGGALFMNAGAFGQQTWDVVSAVTTVDRAGHLRTRPATDYEIHYRHVICPANEWFVASYFQLKLGNAAQSKEHMQYMLEKRRHSHPIQLPNAGSVFRNPEGKHAAQLIASAGLQGFKMGGAQVSDQHANFIVNVDQATADDIQQLIQHVIDVVETKHGIRLEPEVKIVR